MALLIEITGRGIAEMTEETKKTRETRQKTLLINALAAAPDRHFSAEELDELLRAGGSDIGIATIYRNLKRFEAEGIVERISCDDGGARYQYSSRAQDAHSHHHLICNVCHKIEDFDVDFLDSIENLITEKTGFEISDHQLIFYGTCAECRAKLENSGK